MLYRQPNNPRRQKLLRPHYPHAAAVSMQMFPDVEALRRGLQDAIALELFTIPPYLCALYSIRPGANVEAARIIQTVVMEEMLHLMLAANILNAVGAAPQIHAQTFLPSYPKPLPHSSIGFTVNLLRFSKEAVNTFLRIERPAPAGGATAPGTFASIGLFYAALREAMRRLDQEERDRGMKQGIFTGTQKQVKGEHYYGSGGALHAVENLKDAECAIDEIVGQGEGIDGTIRDSDPGMFGGDVAFAHYFRFNEIFHERRYRPGDRPGDAPSGEPLPVDWNAVYNMGPNPSMAKFPKGSMLWEKARACNRIYSEILRNVQRACSGQPEVLMNGIPLMYALRDAAVDLMNEPSGMGDYTAGPTFEYLPEDENGVI